MQALSVKNLIWGCLLLLSSALAVYDNNHTTNNNNSGSSLAVSYQRSRSENMAHLLQRQRRWLTFELGAAITLTINIAKAILDTRPRGLLLLAEATSIYDLPAAVEDWLPRRRPKPAVRPPPPPLPVAAAPPVQLSQPIILPFSPADPIHPFYLTIPQGPPLGLERRKSYVNHVQRGCPASNLFKDQYGSYFCRPSVQLAAQRRRLRRELASSGANVVNDYQSPHGMLFDLLTLLSTIHGYQPRYCIMRTLCESRHLLAPSGVSLFHDIVRIMVRYVHPEIVHQPTYRAAFTTGHTLSECASLYGPHCRSSFLLHFTQVFHGKFPST